MAMQVRTRFAPSPTGELHLGNVRIAVLNWLFARHSGGQFILRIEDTDVDRNIEGSEREIVDSLRRLGLEWDEGPDVGGEAGPYRQSERLTLYAETAERLIEEGAAYRCYCSQEQLEAKKRTALAEGGQSSYDGACRDLSAAEEAVFRDAGVEPSIRFRTPDRDTTIHDLIRGDITFAAAELSDFVILKSNGTPTYNFSVVVDDHAMRITHVVRGAGHLSNTPRQVLIYTALGVDPPVFVHVPHVLGPDGSPLSKRRGARSLREYLDPGYHPDAVINYVSLLSWSSPTGEEVLPPSQLKVEIDLDRLGVSDARLDPDKLKWLSGEYVRRMPAEELAQRLDTFIDKGAFGDLQDERLRIAAALQKRIDTFGEVKDFLPQLKPPDPMEWTEEALELLAAETATPLFVAIRDRLQKIEVWSGGAAMDAVRGAGKEVGIKGRELFMPVRAGVTGETKGPELPDIFEIQGREVTVRVIDQVLGEIARRKAYNR